MNKKASFTEQKFGNKVIRRSYSKIKNNFEAPDLSEIQKASFEEFLNVELENSIASIFPIKSPQGKYTLTYNGIKFGDISHDEESCRYESKTYDRPLFVELQLINNETGEVNSAKSRKGSNKPDGIYFGNVPLMSEKGTFVINGIEKFVIAQIIRSPGMYVLNKSQVKLNNSRKRILEGNICELLPHKGPLMLINVPNDKKFIQITTKTSTGDNSVNFMATTLLKAYGLSEEDILNIYGEDNLYIQETLKNEAYNKGSILEDLEIDALLKEIAEELNSTEIDEEECLLRGSPVERKLKRLLYAFYKNNELIKKYESENNIEKSHKVRDENQILLDAIITEKAAKDLFNDLALSTKGLEGQLKNEEKDSSYQAVILLHFFNNKSYDLSSAGRYKLNHKLTTFDRIHKKISSNNITDSKGNPIINAGELFTKERVQKLKETNNKTSISNFEVSTKFEDFSMEENLKPIMNFDLEKIEVLSQTETTTNKISIIGHANNEKIESHSLTIVDLLSTISYAYNLIDDIGTFDDIDHLGNKRLKLIHELLKSRINVAILRIEKNIKEKLAIADGGTSNEHFVADPEVTEEKVKKTTIKSIVNTKPFQIILKDFFNSYQLIQFIDQQNPLSELTNKRRISAMGPNGISREDPNLDIRDVHYSHYGRICPIETPEGMNIGLIMSLSLFSKVDKNGFITTPYKVVKNNVVTDEIEWLTPLQDDEFIIAEATVELNDSNEIVSDNIIARYRGSFNIFTANQIDYVEIAPKQVVSIAASSIPFLENDDANRALMGSNMQRQALPLIKPYSPWVGTGSEYKIANDSGLAVLSKTDGKVSAVDGNEITITDEKSKKHTYPLIKYRKSNQNTTITQTPMIKLNEQVEAGQVLATGPSMQNGELALGNNVLVGFSTWRGYNFEDAIILSERLVEEDTFTSIHINEYTIQCLQTKNGDEEITREMPNVSENAKRYLDEDGIIMVGAEVKEGDVLVGKVTPKGAVDLPPEEKLLQVIFGEKSKNFKDSSLKIPHGGEGIVASVKRYKNTDENNSELGDDVIEVVKIYVIQKRKIQVGDKMAGRHGNKGVVSKIVPVEDMPFMDDGTPIDILLNPLGVPSRMNIGQILELHLGYAAREKGKKELLALVFEKNNAERLSQLFGLDIDVANKLLNVIQNLIDENKSKTLAELLTKVKTIDLIIALNKVGLSFEDIGFKIATPVFDGVQSNDLENIMIEAGIDPIKTKAKFTLRDGKTGEYFDGDIAVGIMYMLKLDHMVDDKIHARSVGPYSKITQQPLGGKSQNGGQRFGEMEVWALEAYGAAHNLYEILTIKSDDVRGRNMTYNAIIKGHDIPTGKTPESFKLLTKQLQGLGLYLEVETENNIKIDMNDFIDSQNALNTSKELDEEVTNKLKEFAPSIDLEDDLDDESF